MIKKYLRFKRRNKKYRKNMLTSLVKSAMKHPFILVDGLN